MYENRIKHLEEMHRVLDKKIDTLEKNGLFEDLKLEDLKKQRLLYKDEIAILRAKQAGLEEWNASIVVKTLLRKLTVIGDKVAVRIDHL